MNILLVIKCLVDVCSIAVRILLFSEHYDLQNPDEKYDCIPEIWEGHNVADFVDPDILEVRSM